MSQPLRILLVTKSTGGVAEYIRRMLAVPGLDRNEFEFSVACLSENGPAFAAELSQVAGVQAFSLEMNRYQVDPISDARVLFALAAHLRRERYDLVHAHASKPGFLTRLAAIGTGIPVLYSPHCFAFHAGAGRLNAQLVAMLERLAARFLTARIVAIANGERELARKFGVGSDALFVTVHSGLDPQPYRGPVDVKALKKSMDVPEEALLVGTVGRLSKQKSPFDFVRMAAAVHRERPEIHFSWIGSGPLEDEARQLSAELGLDEVLHFAGQRSNVPELLQAMQCFVLTSHWEGFPLVVLEAMAAGAPVVAADILGVDEAIRNGQDGMLVPVGDAEAMAQAVLGQLNNNQLADRYRKSAGQRLEQEFTPAAMLDGLTSIYRQTACRHGSVRGALMVSPGKESL